MIKKEDKIFLMNLPSDVRAMIDSGTFCLYKLAKVASNGAPYLLEFSQDKTCYVSEDGRLLESAGNLRSIEVREVVRFTDSGSHSGIKVNIA